MLNKEFLRSKLLSLDGKDYGGYQSLLGEYDFSDYKLLIYQIPKDPYAPPSTGIYCIRVSRSDRRFINIVSGSRINEIAFRDFLTRRFYRACSEVSKGKRGTGFSGTITINQPGQAVLDRNCIIMDEEMIEIRCFLGLPASGRKIISKAAEEMLFEELPEILKLSLFKKHHNPEELKNHLHTVEDAEYLRNRLDLLGLSAFIADNSILPRKSGISDQSMSEETAVPFSSPPNLRIEIKVPNAGSISGMGIPKGITLITGGGFHGKSTLLKVLESGIYNHIPGDGREQCVSSRKTVKVRAYSGRSVTKTDISQFIRNLPFQKDTKEFSTENSSGSTSQAACIIEAVEVGADLLLLDEDTCAANFMIRDFRMQQLVQKCDEPITPFIDKVKQLFSEKQVSTILVLGGSGDYFDVADRVLQMIMYKPVDVSQKAYEISSKSPDKRITEEEKIPFSVIERIPLAESINPHNDYGKKRIYAKEIHRLNFGKSIVDLKDLEQLSELSQTKAIGCALDYARKYMDQKSTVKEIINKVIVDINNYGLDIISDRISGYFAEFRPFELAFVLNRLRGIIILQRRN